MLEISKLMSPEQFRELRHLAAKEPAVLEITLVKLDAGGYAANGKYLGVCAKGERIHRVDTEYGALYVRSRANAKQLQRVLSIT